MKQTITVLTMAVFFAACSNQPKTNDTLVKDKSALDTTGLYTNENRVMDLDGLNDTTVTTITTTTVTKSVNGQPVAVTPAEAPAQKVPVRKAATTARKSTSSNSGTVSRSGTSTQPTAQVSKKEGWSKAAKGTAIGAGSGAVLGAIVSKKKGKGAIIGGVIGAGVGYGIGRAKDKKDGRY